MTPTMLALGWTGALAMVVAIAALIGVIVLYHIWLDRRLETERACGEPPAKGD